MNASAANNSTTPLYAAAKNGHPEVVKVLLEQQADVNVSCTDDGFTPLHAAAEKGHREVVKLLLANKADLSAKCHSGETPFEVGRRNHHLDIVTCS